MRIGVFGGTFDPPHLAHLVTAETAHSQLNLDEVIFIPAGDPWQKQNQAIAKAEVRLRMVKAAIDGVGYFAADDREIRRSGPSKGRYAVFVERSGEQFASVGGELQVPDEFA